MRSYNKISKRTGKGRNTSFKNELKQHKTGTSRFMFYLSQTLTLCGTLPESCLVWLWIHTALTGLHRALGGMAGMETALLAPAAHLGGQGIKGSPAVDEEDTSGIPIHSNTLLG